MSLTRTQRSRHCWNAETRKTHKRNSAQSSPDDFAISFDEYRRTCLGNTAQSPPDGFARSLRADFPSYCPEIPCHTAVCLRNFRQSAKLTRPYAQALCGVALETAVPFLPVWQFFSVCLRKNVDKQHDDLLYKIGDDRNNCGGG